MGLPELFNEIARVIEPLIKTRIVAIKIAYSTKSFALINDWTPSIAIIKDCQLKKVENPFITSKSDCDVVCPDVFRPDDSIFEDWIRSDK